MSLLAVLLLAVALSLDAFAVAVASGCALRPIRWEHYCRIGGAFGFFQFFMPVVGWLLGQSVHSYIEAWDHWIAFVLLCVIGANMIREAGEAEECSSSMGVREMLSLAVATSIDALAVGVTFAFLKVDIIPAITLIGLTTFAFSATGVKIGSVFGGKYKSAAERAGGIALIIIGTKILLEHLGILL